MGKEDILRSNCNFPNLSRTQNSLYSKEKNELERYSSILNTYQQQTEELSRLKQEQSQTEDEIAEIKKKIEIYTERLIHIKNALCNNQTSNLNNKVEQIKEQIDIAIEEKRHCEKCVKHLLLEIDERVEKPIPIGSIFGEIFVSFFMIELPMATTLNNVFGLDLLSAYFVSLIPTVISAMMYEFRRDIKVSFYKRKARINKKRETKYVNQLKKINQKVKLLLEQNPDDIKSKDELENEKKQSEQTLELLKKQLQVKGQQLDDYNDKIKRKHSDIDDIYNDLLVSETQLLLQGNEVESIGQTQEQVKKLGEYPKRRI